MQANNGAAVERQGLEPRSSAPPDRGAPKTMEFRNIPQNFLTIWRATVNLAMRTGHPSCRVRTRPTWPGPERNDKKGTHTNEAQEAWPRAGRLSGDRRGFGQRRSGELGNR